MDVFMYWANMIILFIFPQCLILVLFISLIRFIYAKIVNKLRPGTVPEPKMKILKKMLVVYIIAVAVLLAVDAGILLLLDDGIPNM